MSCLLRYSWLFRRSFSKQGKFQGPLGRVIVYRHPPAVRGEPPSSTTYVVKLCSRDVPPQVVDFRVSVLGSIQVLLNQFQQIAEIQNAGLWKGSTCLSPESPISSLLENSITLKGTLHGTDISVPFNGGLPLDSGNYSTYNIRQYATLFAMLGGVVLFGLIVKLQMTYGVRQFEDTVLSTAIDVWRDPKLSFWDKVAVPLYTPTVPSKNSADSGQRSDTPRS